MALTFSTCSLKALYSMKMSQGFDLRCGLNINKYNTSSHRGSFPLDQHRGLEGA